jgi:hypothetical protein
LFGAHRKTPTYLEINYAVRRTWLLTETAHRGGESRSVAEVLNTLPPGNNSYDGPKTASIPNTRDGWDNIQYKENKNFATIVRELVVEGEETRRIVPFSSF